MAEFNVLNKDQQEQIIQPFTEFSATIERQTLIAVIRDTLHRFEKNDYKHQLSKMTDWAQPPSPPPAPDPGPEPDGKKPPQGITPPRPIEPKPKIEYVSCQSISVPFNEAWLANESDVERYLSAMRKALLEQIQKGKRIQI